jgi:citrate synthase
MSSDDNQYADNRLIRPTSRYIGELYLPWTPLDERKA